MADPYADVLEFYAKFDLPIGIYPQRLPQERLTFRFTRIVEEAAEFCQAARQGNLDEAAQELIDIVYFALGTAIEMGVPFMEVWNLVHAANMQKEPSNGRSSLYGEKLDVVKPPGWKSPAADVRRLINEHLERAPLHIRYPKAQGPHAKAVAKAVAFLDEITSPQPLRPSLDRSMLEIAAVLARRAACVKRKVGCVLTDEHGRIVGSGYNGRAHGQANCEGAGACRTVSCEGVHAETNALQAAAWGAKPVTAYVTTAPCWHCVKQLANSSVRRIVTPDGLTWETRSDELWTKLGRIYECLPP